MASSGIDSLRLAPDGESDFNAPVQRGLLAIAVLFQLTSYLARPWAWPGVTTSTLAAVVSASVLLSTLALGLTLARFLTPFRIPLLALNVAVLLFAGFAQQIAPISPGGWTGSTFFLESAALSMATVTVAFLLPSAVSAPFTLAVGIADIAFVYALRGDSLDLAEVIMPGIAVMAAGLTSLAVRALLVASGRRVIRERARVEAMASSGVDEEARRQVEGHEVRIHEQVLNVLSALKHSDLRWDSSARDRVMAAAETLESLDGSAERDLSGDLQVDLLDLHRRLSNAGVDVLVTGPTRLDVGSSAYPVLVDALREALINIERHAAATKVSIATRRSVALDRGHVWKEWAVEVTDNGVGFENESVLPRFGMARILGGMLTERGITSSVSSAPGEGTTIRFQARGPFLRPTNVDRRRLSGLALAYNGTYFAVSALALVLTSGQVQRPLLNVAGLLVAGVVLIGFGLFVRARGVPWWSIPVAVALMVVAVRLQVAAGPSPDDPWSQWGVIAANAAAFTLCVVGPWWTVVVLVAASSLMSQPGPVPQAAPYEGLLAAQFVLMGVVVGFIVRWTQRRVEDLQRQQAEARSKALAETSVRDHMRTRVEAMRTSGSVAWLRTVAHDQHCDPSEAARHEHFLRSIMNLDASSEAYHRWVAELTAIIWQQSLRPDVHLHDDGTRSPSSVPPLPEWLPDFLGCQVTDSAIRITGGVTDGSVVLSLVGTARPGRVSDMRSCCGTDLLADDATGSWVLEVRL